MLRSFFYLTIIFFSLAHNAYGMSYKKRGDVIVHLFEWKWNDIAKECEQHLAPLGVFAVQVSPPHEHVVLKQWWARYQVASYKLISRSGNEKQFVNMVRRCNNVGVKIIVDAVINHMSSFDGIGFGETPFRKRDYVDYSFNDFHRPCSIEDYYNRWQVQNCDLVGISDLDTSSPYVQKKISDYLNKLIDIGVSGFRIDAAKHISHLDLKNILNKVHGKPFIYQEVIDLGGEPIKSSEYFDLGRVTEFRYGAEVAKVFLGGKLSSLKNLKEGWQSLMPSDRAIVFLDNHDNQRGHGGNGEVLTYKYDHLYAIANVIMLAMPYGIPRIMSSYRFSSSDEGPPQSYVYSGNQVHCFTDWVCEHRWRAIQSMIKFRKFVASTPLLNWWDNSNNQISFSRGNLGFVVVNKERLPMDRWLYTNLPEGKYCNIIKGEIVPFPVRTCSGDVIEVFPDGRAHFMIGSEDVAVIYRDQKI